MNENEAEMGEKTNEVTQMILKEKDAIMKNTNMTMVMTMIITVIITKKESTDALLTLPNRVMIKNITYQFGSAQI